MEKLKKLICQISPISRITHKMISKQNFILIFLTTISLLLFILIGWTERKFKTRLPQIFVAEPYRQANIKIDSARLLGPLPQSFLAFGQGGEEGGGIRMLEPTVSLMQAVKPRYIRLDHIFDDDFYGVVKAKDGQGLVLDWSKLDATVQDILAMGAKPFFVLSYMPGALGESKISVPKNWQDWQELVQKTIEHYSSSIGGVYYEVWNEPSLPSFGSFKMYGDKDYRQLYRFAALGAAQAQGVKPFKIGGPAIPELDPAWIRLLLDYVQANNLRLDFLSWHRYSALKEVYLNDIYELNVLLAEPKYQSFSNLEKVISEWGPNSEKDPAYSSNIAASHGLTIIRRLMDQVSWLISFEVKDGPDEDQAGWGLFTHQNQTVKPKPRYKLYQWLAELTGQRVEITGEGSNVSGLVVKDDQGLKIILSNFSPQGGGTENIPITITNLADGQYQLTKEKLAGLPEESIVQASGGQLNLSVELEMYGVVKVTANKL